MTQYLIFLTALILAGIAASRGGRYLARNMDASGRMAVAMLLAPAPQFVTSAALAPTSFGWIYDIAAFFVLSYGTMVLLYLPVYIALALLRNVEQQTYSLICIGAVVLACVALFFFITPASFHPEPDVRFRTNVLYVFMALALLAPGAALASSIFWRITVSAGQQNEHNSSGSILGELRRL